MKDLRTREFLEARISFVSRLLPTCTYYGQFSRGRLDDPVPHVMDLPEDDIAIFLELG